MSVVNYSCPTSGSSRTILRDSEIDEYAWDAYVAMHPEASIYHHTPWQRVISETFGKQIFRLASIGGNGKLNGVLPMVRLNGPLLPDMMISMPYCSYGGPLSDDAYVETVLLSEACSICEALGCDLVEMRNAHGTAADPWKTRSDKVQMLLKLPESTEALAKSLGAKRRSQVNRARRENPEVRSGGAELISDFYAVFARKMRDLGTPVYPEAFFRSVEKHHSDKCLLIVIYLDGKPAAAAFLMRHRETLEIPWAAADSRYNRFSVNMLLYWEALGLAISTACSSFDFGRCTIGSNTYRFKRQWGAAANVLEWRYQTREAESGGGSAGGRAMQALSRAWQRLPLSVANWLGPKITSNLPW